MSGMIARSLFFAAGFLWVPSLSSGCSCAGPAPVCSLYWNTSALFLGHVTRVEHVYDKPPEERVVNGKTVTLIGPGGNLVHFEVFQSYRGSPDGQVVVSTHDQGSACGYQFEIGHDYLVYGFADQNGKISTNHCTRTHEVKSRADDEDIQWLEALPRSPPGASIFGHIRSHQPNADGGYDSTGLAGITVSVSGPQSRTLTTDASGKFRVDALPPGKYTVSAAEPERYTVFPSSTVTLQDHGCAEIPWSTQLDGHISGHVYYPDGTPAAGLYLTAHLANTNERAPWASQEHSVMSKADGSFDFSPLSPGSYLFGVNLSFGPSDAKSYYRKAFFPGTINQTEAATIDVGAGEKTENLRFFLPPDLPPPSIQVPVTVLGFDGKPVTNATVLAADDIWENSVTSVMGTTNQEGKATITLRPGSHYDVETSVDLPDFSQACAEPVGIDVKKDEPAPLVLVLRHHIGNCLLYKERRAH